MTLNAIFYLNAEPILQYIEIRASTNALCHTFRTTNDDNPALFLKMKCALPSVEKLQKGRENEIVTFTLYRNRVRVKQFFKFCASVENVSRRFFVYSHVFHDQHDRQLENQDRVNNAQKKIDICFSTKDESEFLKNKLRPKRVNTKQTIVDTCRNTLT